MSRFPVVLTGICGSDRLRLRQGQAPFELGHEPVVEHGGGVAALRPVAGCGSCRYCTMGRIAHCPGRISLGKDGRAGAFAGSLEAETEQLYPLDEADRSILPVFALVDGVACVLNGLSRLHTAPRSWTVLGRGAMAKTAQVLMVERWGEARSVPSGSPEKADLVVEAAGRSVERAFDAAVDACDAGGTVVSFSVFPPDRLSRRAPRAWLEREIAVIGVNSYRYERGGNDDFADAVALVRRLSAVLLPLVSVVRAPKGEADLRRVIGQARGAAPKQVLRFADVDQ